MSKCSFAQSQVEYLGHIISVEGVSADPSKIACMLDWPEPKTVKALRGFLGLTGYYRRFIRSYGEIARPLNKLLQKDQFNWNPEAAVAFQDLKKALSTPPVLALPDFTQQFVIETDASSKGIRAVLMQGGRPLAFLSKALAPKHMGLSVYEKELLAIIQAVNKWRAYLIGAHFVIKTDHQSLKFFMEQKLSTFLQQKWLSKMLGYDYEITYKKGVENVVADALSRQGCEEQTNQLMAISGVVPAWLQEIITTYEGDVQTQSIIQQLSIQPNSVPDFSLQKNVLKHKGLIYIGSMTDLRKRVFSVFHESSVGGHSGIQATLKKLGAYFTWSNMTEDIKTWVKECDICQRHKTESVPYPGLLQPLDIPNRPWTDISMDFIEGLPSSEGKTVILVVVDRFSKFSHFIGLQHPYTAATIAKVFIDHIYKLHGLPQNIVTDRDKVFISTFWQTLFKQLGVQLCLSSAYHPQSDGQTERLNRCLECYLRCMCSEHPKKWLSWLSLAQWWYNTNYHTALKCTPFQALFGFHPPHLNFHQIENTRIPAVDSFIKDRNAILADLKERLLQAQVRMKNYADQKRTERSFDVGDSVYLKLQPYKQSSLAQKSNFKLAPRYYGPYKILEKVGTVAYKLDLPSHAQIHNVFHVSLLKKQIGSQAKVAAALPLIAPDGRPKIVPVAVLQKRMVKIQNKPKIEYLIQWANSNEEDASWEDAKQMVLQFPEFNFSP